MSYQQMHIKEVKLLLMNRQIINKCIKSIFSNDSNNRITHTIIIVYSFIAINLQLAWQFPIAIATAIAIAMR